ncbi:MAG: primosomal protein N' [Oscillospiraceae bacterium]|nr:primosomal protein N' [Oscillospiraceae bacterium]
MNEPITGTVALVAVEKALYSFDRLYSYAVPYELVGVVTPGKRVLVPFGRGTRKIIGMVFAVEEREYEPLRVKGINEVIDDTAHMNDEMLRLAEWLKENTFCTYYTAVRCILPPALKSGAVLPDEKLKTHKILQLSLAELPPQLTPKQRSVIEALENNSASVKELCYLCGVTASVVTTLVKKGVLEEIEVLQEEEVILPSRSADDICLNEEQSTAFATLLDLLDTPAPKCALLHGVTGSGKTSVFIKLVGVCLARGQSALVLVPEIALTPQTIAIFNSYFGDTAAIIHSGLSMSRRTAEYRRIASGEAKIVLGTRSAVFAPLDNIGLIVIDEEGEHTYKSERSPRYHARDVAKQRCFRHNALLVLASATPSMDSYRRAVTQKYTLIRLDKRYSGNRLPDVRIIDMKFERQGAIFSNELLDGLKRNLSRGEQSLVLLNRRGYFTHVCCMTCGEVAMCPHCSVALTYHKANNRLSCHYCGLSVQCNNRCGKCGSGLIRSTGTGTQRVQDELQTLFPTARILRMDADTTQTRGAYERGFGSFGKQEYDIMVGTQMIAKGLDFPNVTLVGILLIDNSLYAGDYIGYERTFSLITQVVGRAGRADKGGTAFLQTFTPEHYVMQLAANQDYRGFYEEEAAIRQALSFPPFCDLCIVEVSDVVEQSAADTAAAFLLLFNEELTAVNAVRETPLFVRVLGPVRSGAGNVGGMFRERLVVKCKNAPAFRGVVRAALSRIGEKRGSARVVAWFE